MVVTAILGVFVAALFAVGLRHIYRNFFKGESTCCSSEGGGCAGCIGHADVQNGYRKRIERVESFELRKTIDVDGMTCEHCVANVTKALENVDGVAAVAVSLEKRAAEAALEKDVPDEVLKEAIRKAGYKPGACAAA